MMIGRCYGRCGESRPVRVRRPYLGGAVTRQAPYAVGALCGWRRSSLMCDGGRYLEAGVTRRAAGRDAAAPCEWRASGGWNRSFLERRERREARREESASRGHYNHHGAAIGREERKARVREAAFPQTILCTNFCVGRCVCVCLGSGMVKVRSPARSTACERCELHERCVA